MKPFCLLLAALALTSAQKSSKQASAGGKPGGSSYSYPDLSSHKAYPSAPSYQSGPSGYGNAYANSGLQQKQVYPQLIQDNRQFNHDGTINYQYAADNGLQQGEVVDPDGTRRGFYSYIGADGKPLTVKYTAGKNGFIAEGAHLPKQPAPILHAESSGSEATSKQQYQGGPGGSGGDYDDGSYRPELYEHPYANSGSGSSGSGPSGPAGGQYYASGPGAYSAAQSQAPAYRPSNSQAVISRPKYSPPSPYHDGPNFAGAYRGQSSQYQGSPQTQYPQAVPSYGGPRGGSGYSALNPYAPTSAAGPYNGQFDLGNGGQFSINFEPGQSQEVGGPQGAYSNLRPKAVPSRPRH